MENFVGNVYYKNSSDIKFHERYVTFNPLHNQLEDEATRSSIASIGQIDPIIMLNGYCIDGRHRVKILNELNQQVKCIDISPALNEQQVIKLCNVNTTSGRDFNSAQKAIQALKLVIEFKFKAAEAARTMKVDKRLVSYASTIRGYGRQDLLDALLAGKKIQLDGMKYPSQSLELICKFVKIEAEKEKTIEDTSERIYFNPEAIIKTETGKAWFYQEKELIGVDFDNPRYDRVLFHMMELANYKFKLIITPDVED